MLFSDLLVRSTDAVKHLVLKFQASLNKWVLWSALSKKVGLSYSEHAGAYSILNFLTVLIKPLQTLMISIVGWMVWTADVCQMQWCYIVDCTWIYNFI